MSKFLMYYGIKLLQIVSKMQYTYIVIEINIILFLIILQFFFFFFSVVDTTVLGIKLT